MVRFILYEAQFLASHILNLNQLFMFISTDNKAVKRTKSSGWRSVLPQIETDVVEDDFSSAVILFCSYQTDRIITSSLRLLLCYFISLLQSISLHPRLPPPSLPLLFGSSGFPNSLSAFSRSDMGGRWNTDTNDSSQILLQSVTVCVRRKNNRKHIFGRRPRGLMNAHSWLVCVNDVATTPFPPSSLHLLQFVSLSSQSKPHLCYGVTPYGCISSRWGSGGYSNTTWRQQELWLVSLGFLCFLLQVSAAGGGCWAWRQHEAS